MLVAVADVPAVRYGWIDTLQPTAFGSNFHPK